VVAPRPRAWDQRPTGNVGLLRLRNAVLSVGTAALAAAVIASPAHFRAATRQTWPPFVLVAGLLTIGVVAHRDGLFELLGNRAARLRAHPVVLLLALLGVVAAVTAILNLDTSVAFLTPVLILAARAQGLDEEPFLYGTLFMSNAASLLLPGSNLTNLLVLAGEHVSGAVFAARMLPAWVASVAVTAAFTVAAYRHWHTDAPTGASPQRVAPKLGWSAVAIALAAVLVLVLRSPSLAIAALGIVLAALAIQRRSISTREVWDAVEPATLAGVFGIAVALGTLARGWSGPAHLMARASRPETIVIGAVASVAVNNLPAAVLLASRPAAHPRALLLGLDLGPSLAVTGSLSALIWFRAARAVGAHPSAVRVSRLGIVLVPVSLAAAALALWLFSPAPL
jgi:arsenical pump membrane protein